MLHTLLAGCRREERTMQHRLYDLYYAYALTICLRYTRQRDEALEVVNDGFLMVFRGIGRFDPDRHELTSSFRGWLKKIMIRAAISRFRAAEKHAFQDDLAALPHEPADATATVLDSLAYDDLVRLIQLLPPGYRAVFNLYAIDGCTHEEIAKYLNINVGTSKSNLSKARAHLQYFLKKTSPHVCVPHVG